MALSDPHRRPPSPARMRLFHNANGPKRVEINVPAGDELEVSENVAAQLIAADSHFQPVTEPAEAEPGTAPAEAGPKKAAKKAGKPAAGE